MTILRAAERVVGAVVRVVLATAGAAAVGLVRAAIHAVALLAPLEQIARDQRVRRTRWQRGSGQTGSGRGAARALADMSEAVEEQALALQAPLPVRLVGEAGLGGVHEVWWRCHH